MMVLSRWAIVKTVQSRNLSLIVIWIKASVLGRVRETLVWHCYVRRGVTHLWSTLAVASSITNIRFLRRIALARHTSCLCPTEKFDPPSVMLDSSPADSSDTACLSFTSSNAAQRVSSSYSPKGSKFLLRVPENSTGSCGMILIFERRSCKPIAFVSMPSMVIWPSGSVSRNSDPINDDFPAPVRPTMPIYIWEVTSRQKEVHKKIPFP